MSNTKQRFASLTENELGQLTDNKNAKNTKTATKHSVKLFRSYLREKEFDIDFENFTNDTLSSKLRSFYAEVRNGSGERYKRTTLLSVRSGLCRYLNQTKNIDISKDSDFKQANEMFLSVCKDTFKSGKGTIDHKIPIEKADMERLYTSRAFDTSTPYGLVNKVWFELCLYFCRRGRENQRELKPSMFTVRMDAAGKRYVCQVNSEISKNHQGIKSNEIEDKNVRMYETGGNSCPVKSFEKYLNKRNPNCEALFQTPRDSFYDTDSIWFENRPLGKNKLGNKMKELSIVAELSQQYTNHCIRATAITALSHAGFEARHIMTVSGHRNEASVKSYVRDTTAAQKKEMSATISSLAPETQNDFTVPDDGFDDILTLSLSQTESILKDITAFENQTSNDDSTPRQVTDQEQVSSSSASGLRSSVCSERLDIQNIAPAQGHSSFSFHGCQIQFHNYN